jgi:hypothetical protein
VPSGQEPRACPRAKRAKSQEPRAKSQAPRPPLARTRTGYQHTTTSKPPSPSYVLYMPYPARRARGGDVAAVHLGMRREIRGTTLIPFEQIKPDYLLWGCFRWSFASSSTPAGCLLQLVLIHGLDEGARGAKSQREKKQ